MAGTRQMGNETVITHSSEFSWSRAHEHPAQSITYSGRGTPDYSDSEDLHDTMGQLSLDDASQIRYHGKASGLHLLGQTERLDRRAENGIW